METKEKKIRGLRAECYLYEDAVFSSYDDIYFKLACYYIAKTELYDRTLTDLRDRYDPTEAFVASYDARINSIRYSLNLHSMIVLFAEEKLSIPKEVFIPKFRKRMNEIHLSAQGWIDTYNYLVEKGEMDFIENFRNRKGFLE